MQLKNKVAAAICFIGAVVIFSACTGGGSVADANAFKQRLAEENTRMAEAAQKEGAPGAVPEVIEINDMSELVDTNECNTLILGDSTHYQIEYVVMNNEDAARRIFEENEVFFNQWKEGATANYHATQGNFSMYTMLLEKQYFAVSRVDTHVLLITVDAFDEEEQKIDYKKISSANKLMKDLGFGYR